jgi:ArsR family transcriptional regulator
MVRQLEKIFKALGDRNRLRIVNMLGQKPMCVCEITHVLKLSQSTVSGHLRVLKEAELVEDKKEGLWVVYYLNRSSTHSTRILELVNQSLRDDPQAAEERESALKAKRNEIKGLA